MKKYFFLASAMTLMFASCSSDIESEVLAPDTNGTHEITLTASLEEDSQTRVNYTSTGSFFWTNNDKIAVYNTNNTFSELTIVAADAGKASAKFSGSISGSTTKCAIYPASAAAGSSVSGDVLTFNLPASYTYTEMQSDFPTDMTAAVNTSNMPMMAKITTDGQTNLRFENLAGLFCFKFLNVPANTDKIVFTSTEGWKLNGTYNIDISSSYLVFKADMTTKDEEKSITINIPKTATVSDRVVYFPLPYCTYRGYKVEMFNGTTLTASMESSKENT